MSEEKEIGIVSGYFSHVGVAAIKLSDSLSTGVRIRLKGATTDFEMDVEEIQIDRKSVERAEAGEHVGIKVSEKVRPNDKVFLVE
jgi:putative protease